jgi:hypothetical protein
MLKKILLGASLLCAATITNAATVTVTGEQVLKTTNWEESISIADFDTSLGTLTGVTFAMSGQIEGDAKVESLDAAPATITVNLDGQIDLFDLAGNLLQVNLPSTSDTFSASAFDGTIDFAGTSGSELDTLMASAMSGPTDLNDIVTVLTLADFTDGVMNVYNVAAMAQSSATGAGNIITQFGTRAAALVTVTYTYTPTPVVGVSSPSHIALLGLGLVGLAGVRRLRK